MTLQGNRRITQLQGRIQEPRDALVYLPNISAGARVLPSQVSYGWLGVFAILDPGWLSL